MVISDNLVKNKPSVFTFSLIAICVTIIILSAATVIAREEMSVQILPLSGNEVAINTQVQLVANATGGSGQYLYRWYVNNIGTGNNITSSTYIFNANKTGTFTFLCQVYDATGLVTGGVTSPEVVLFVTTQPLVAGQGPTASPETGLGNPELTVIIIAVVGVVAAIIAASIIIIKIRKKPTLNNTSPSN